MENVKGFFDSFKEFVWDIIGYLLPGSYIMILLSTCITQDYFISPSLGTSTNEFYTFVFIVISYLLGHAVYGFGWLKERLLGKYSYVKQIEAKVETRKAFSLSKKLISKSLQEKGVIDDLNNTTVRDLRSIAMSFIPEHDQKIYTFTFRSDLSNKAANISIMIGVLGLLSSIIRSSSLDIFKVDKPHVIMYICLIASYFLFRQTRNRFYAISIGLPFSIYTAKEIQS